MNPLVAGVIAAVPGAGAVVLAGIHTPADARLWTWVAAIGVVLAVHPVLRWGSTLALVGILVGVILRAGVVGHTRGELARLTVGWAAVMALPIAAGLGACALALLVVGAPLSPSLPLALAGPVAVVALGVLAMRRRTPQ